MNEGWVGRAWAHGLFAPGPGEDMKAWVIALLPYGPLLPGCLPAGATVGRSPAPSHPTGLKL